MCAAVVHDGCMKRDAAERLAALIVVTSIMVTSIGLSACGGGGGRSDAVVNDERVTSDESGHDSAVSSSVSTEVSGDSFAVDPARFDRMAAELLTMSSDQQEAYLADLATQFERELAVRSGLEAALGGAEAADVALRESWAPIVEQARGIAGAPLVVGMRMASPSSGPNIGEGLFGGLMMVFLGAEGLVTATNDLKQGEPAKNGAFGEGVKVGATLDQATLDGKFTSTSKGVTTSLTTKIVVVPCPDVDGRFKATANIDISATAGSVGQTGTLDVTFDGQLDDNATLASSDSGFRMQWADFAGGKGQFVDVSGSYSGDTFNSLTWNRSGGTVTSEFATSAVSVGSMFGLMLATKLRDAAQKGWESGRCVRLDVAVSPGPKGLEPSSTSTITAAPRSQIDGGPVGGAVTATLTAGGASVDPMSSPLPADATMIYTAPDQPGQSGTVSLEARSKRGVAKAEITFETGGAAYLIVGGLEDWQVSQVVCDVMQPFTLSSGIGTMQLSGGLSGTYEFNGMFDSHYTGTYTISLPPGPDLPGSMIGAGAGSIAGQAGSGSENYVLTPAEC